MPLNLVKKIFLYSIISSVLLVGLLIWLIYFNISSSVVSPFLDSIPFLNAICNSLSAICLSIAYLFIKNKNKKWHQIFIYGALFFSALFFFNYLVYHYFYGDTLYQNDQLFWQIIYFSLLIAHIICSIIMLPFIFSAYFLAVSKEFTWHKKVAHFTFPIWLFVSVSGVLIYFFLY